MNICKRRKLNMDANSVISAFIVSSNQYVLCQNENNLMQLQRHLEILVCLTTTSSDLSFFQNGNPLASQCITHIINLLLDSNAKCTLIPRVLSVLQNLSKCSQLNKNLQSVFHVHSAISVFLQHYGIDVKDPLVLQCLYLLEVVTYNISIDYIESHFENLINALLKLIDTESSQLLKIAFRILTNLTRHNVKIQNYICSLSDASQNIKKIVAMLNTVEPHILVYALSILANLTSNRLLDHPIGAKLWTDEHLVMTFKLIIKLLFGSDETCAIAALDLFLDLINVPKYQLCFIKSPYLNTFLKRIPKIFDTDAKDQSVLYLQILYALVKIPDCSEKVFSVICISEAKGIHVEQESIYDIKIHPKIVQWCIHKDGNEKAHKMSLRLLKSFFEFHIDKQFAVIENSTKEIIKNVLENLSVPFVTELNLLENQLEVHRSVFEILILICQKTNLKHFISQYLNLTVCKDIAYLLLDNFKADGIENNSSYIDLFLMILEVISLIEGDVLGSENISSKILQDHRAMQFIAYALVSNNDECINRGLILISLTKNKSSLNVLSKSILIRNSNLQKRIVHNSEIECSLISDNGQPRISRNFQNIDDSFEKSIDTLLIKIEQGLNIKEIKRSEIMDLYEHKIALLTRKEQELQNYVEAKTIALQKADQIMTQYKCRQADSDAEALRLRTMLKDYESRCEKAVLQFEEEKKKYKQQKDELDVVLGRVKELQKYQFEQKELMQSQMTRQYEQKKVFEEEKIRLTELLHIKDCDKKSLMNQLQQLEDDLKLKNKAYEALEEVKEDLMKTIEESKKSVEKMKSNFEHKHSILENDLESAQHTVVALEEKIENQTIEMNKKMDQYNKQILELEADKNELMEQIKLKDSKIADLTESENKLNLVLNEKNSILKEAELFRDKLKMSLDKSENKNSKLEHDLKMLELLCKRYETSIEEKDVEIKTLTEDLEGIQHQYEEAIKEKENEIKNLEGELKKHKYITGMIHQMTSGKIPSEA